MINAIRFGRSPPPIVLTLPLPPQLRRIDAPELRSRQRIGFSTAPDQNPQNMDDSKNTAKQTGDIMTDSFGLAYACRSEYEGFGGIYRWIKSTEEGAENEKKREYDKSQGSEVKEKEKARHQTHSNC
ncbi:uncharacterized protein LOC111803316 [Cucurbita pepo subsp. pepo]|uniref:uncharacterized protein LOC111803316 n=1 Tax=Cucurbita pepo subsp. pepo TaxID=3664 RepID=UPI000C9D4A2C|nr:uncharacterized protein LOC111803316 [Cucurbita pepo subsp. pepo]